VRLRLLTGSGWWIGWRISGALRTSVAGRQTHGDRAQRQTDPKSTTPHERVPFAKDTDGPTQHGLLRQKMASRRGV
jgi:hypothetical protein